MRSQEKYLDKRELHNEELHTSTITVLIMSRRMRWARYQEGKKWITVTVEKPEDMRPLRRCRHT
jgi:hypothetical protein